ncbi:MULTISPECIES: Bcr/CflA family multidrug efflux MFS transporter [Providencia]|uniref:Bcr/CflA family multidrug efflux MFS transporter n=1 Tax=Providencia TaxID=586 RepID=UPI001981BEF8|nr:MULTISPECIES: Bcr/CflA family multidrug efflux MFS transporter [Providencia]MBN4865719.1 Bcr/CflA family multidrug efflux MFS transporter [Providencia stuartii]MBN4875041.1 Bcr/CflA family multidrug efflux MFS transporter [Providencia stuartii]MBN4879732.1 Bcr/CflA family multidrug efflux MFS transporter [Providencia stuartii]MBN4884240.1 Bcr/CflA family multidrug efflux MFS transporter [Providencia stuartii]HEM8293876.1 Bcr/CflA family multidrug efflux MFS transporter [Providencia stuartii
MVKSFDKHIPHWLIPLLGSLVAFGPLSIDMYLPALPQMGTALQATQGQMQYTLGAFFAGFCVGMLFYGPLSDLLGRRKMLLSGLAIFTVASLLCAQATNANTLIIFRALQAFGSGAAIVMARAIARDVYPANELPKVLSLMTLVTMIAPLLAPLLGGFLLIHFQWQAIFYLLALVGLVSVSTIFLLLPETLVHQRSSENLLCVAFKNYTQVLTDREALSIIGTMAFSFAGMFAFISGSPFVYINYFGVSEQHYGLLFGCNILGMIVMLLLNVKLLKIYSLTRILTMQSGFQLAFGLLLLLFYQQNLPIIVILVVLFLSMVNAIGTNSLSLLLQHRGKIAGSASALAISIQFALAALASVAVSVLQDESPFAMALVMAICAGLSFTSQRLSAKNIRPQIQSVSSEKNEK